MVRAALTRLGRSALVGGPDVLNRGNVGAIGTQRPAASDAPGTILDRTFAAIVIDWDGMAASRQAATARPLRQRLEKLSLAGIHAAVISAGGVEDVDGRLLARPAGTGGLLLGLRRGVELYEVGRTGPRLLLRRGGPTPAELSGLDRASESVVQALAERGVIAHVEIDDERRVIVVGRCPEQDCVVETAADGWWRQRGFADRAEVLGLLAGFSAEAGVPQARVTCGDGRIEIGVNDRADSMHDVVDALSGEGIGSGLLLVIGDGFGRVPDGADAASLWVPDAERATFVSVNPEPGPGCPGVVHLGGGQPMAVRLLDEQLRRSRAMRVPGIDPDPAWTLSETGTDPKLHRVNESLFTVGAGGFATRGSVEEPSPLSVPMVIAAGVYQGNGSEQHPLPGPGWTELAVVPEPKEDVRILDLRTGVLYREETAADGIPLRSLRFASLSLPGLVALRAEAAGGRLRAGPPMQPPGGAVVTYGSADGRRWMRVGSEGSGGIGAVATQRVGRDGGRRTVERLAAYVADPLHQPALPEAQAVIEEAEQRGFDRVLAEHRAAWASRWETVDVRIPDDPEVERAVRFALFQLWCNTGRHDDVDELGVGARGLSGQGYAGHVFWDADVFVLPAMLAIDPRTAQAMVGYRLHRLDVAKERARALGYAGARFPWESAVTGEDVTPAFGPLGAARIPILTGLREEHITADVAWAAVHCATWLGQTITATSREWPLLRETARYWASRCRRDPDGSAHIDDVIGPDEYHESVNDNAFTNVMARWNLRAAADIGESVRGMEAECHRWREIAAALVDGYDPATRRYEQFAGYYDLEPLLVHDYAPPPVAADILFGRERVSQSQTIKQADVLMMHHLIPDDLAPGSLGPNLDFYGPRTAHGSSLSPAISASLLARAGRSDNALSLLRLALGVDLDDLTGTTAGGLHLATLGGIWQAMLVGFTGVRVRAGTLCLDPDLPTSWRSLEVRFRCLGRRVRVHVRPEAIEVVSDRPLRVQLAGRAAREITGHATFDR